MRLVLQLTALVDATIWAFNIDIPLTRTVSFLEVVWVVVNAVGAYYSLSNYRDARESLRAALDPPVDKAATIMAKMATSLQKYITITQVGFGVLGVVSWFTPPPNGENTGRTVIVLGLIGLASLLAWMSRRVRAYRLAAFAALEEERREQADA